MKKSRSKLTGVLIQRIVLLTTLFLASFTTAQAHEGGLQQTSAQESTSEYTSFGNTGTLIIHGDAAQALFEDLLETEGATQHRCVSGDVVVETEKFLCLQHETRAGELEHSCHFMLWLKKGEVTKQYPCPSPSIIGVMN